MAVKTGILGLKRVKMERDTSHVNSKQLHIYFTGLVQGVGFRWNCKRLAGGLDILGWVQNLEDGRVEMVAEGATAQLQSLMDRLHNRFTIESIEMRENKPSFEFSTFEIRR